MKKVEYKQDNSIEGICILYNKSHEEFINELKRILHFHIFKIKVRTTTGKYAYVSLMDIYYIEVIDGQCFLCSKNEIYKALVSFKELKDELNGNGFVQCNKIQMFNEHHLDSLEKEKDCQRIAKLDNGDVVLVSRKYKDTVDKYKDRY